MNRVAQSVPLRVAAAARCPHEHPAGRLVNSQARTPALPRPLVHGPETGPMLEVETAPETGFRLSFPRPPARTFLQLIWFCAWLICGVDGKEWSENGDGRDRYGMASGDRPWEKVFVDRFDQFA